jgi:hypothetical protein
MEGSVNIRPSIRMTNTMRESIRKSKTRATKGELKAALSAALTKMSGNSAEQRLIRQIAAMMNRRQDIMAFISIGFGFRVYGLCLGFRLDSVNPISLSVCLSVCLLYTSFTCLSIVHFFHEVPNRPPGEAVWISHHRRGQVCCMHAAQHAPAVAIMDLLLSEDPVSNRKRVEEQLRISYRP